MKEVPLISKRQLHIYEAAQLGYWNNWKDVKIEEGDTIVISPNKSAVKRYGRSKNCLSLSATVTKVERGDFNKEWCDLPENTKWPIKITFDRETVELF